jgi:hypothetical protein
MPEAGFEKRGTKQTGGRADRYWRDGIQNGDWRPKMLTIWGPEIGVFLQRQKFSDRRQGGGGTSHRNGIWWNRRAGIQDGIQDGIQEAIWNGIRDGIQDDGIQIGIQGNGIQDGIQGDGVQDGTQGGGIQNRIQGGIQVGIQGDGIQDGIRGDGV